MDKTQKVFVPKNKLTKEKRMSKRSSVTAFTAGRNIIYGKPLPEYKPKEIKQKKRESILIKKDERVIE